MPQTWAILLAAGESRRMGELKALLPWQGATLIEHQVASLFDGGVDGIVAVVGHQADHLVPLLERCDERYGNLVWATTAITCSARPPPSRPACPPSAGATFPPY